MVKFFSPFEGDLEIGEETGEETATGEPSTVDSFPASTCLAGLESFAFPLPAYGSRHNQYEREKRL